MISGIENEVKLLTDEVKQTNAKLDSVLFMVSKLIYKKVIIKLRI
jgi:hypothetical protein